MSRIFISMFVLSIFFNIYLLFKNDKLSSELMIANGSVKKIRCNSVIQFYVPSTSQYNDVVQKVMNKCNDFGIEPSKISFVDSILRINIYCTFDEANLIIEYVCVDGIKMIKYSKDDSN